MRSAALRTSRLSAQSVRPAPRLSEDEAWSLKKVKEFLSTASRSVLLQTYFANEPVIQRHPHAPYAAAVRAQLEMQISERFEGKPWRSVVEANRSRMHQAAMALIADGKIPAVAGLTPLQAMELANLDRMLPANPTLVVGIRCLQFQTWLNVDPSDSYNRVRWERAIGELKQRGVNVENTLRLARAQ